MRVLPWRIEPPAGARLLPRNLTGIAAPRCRDQLTMEWPIFRAIRSQPARPGRTRLGSDGAPGVRALRSVAPVDRWQICCQFRRAHVPLTSRSPGSIFTRRSPPSSVKPPLKLTHGGQSQAHPSRLLGFGPVGKPCRRGDCPHKRPVLPWALSSLRYSGIRKWMRRHASRRHTGQQSRGHRFRRRSAHGLRGRSSGKERMCRTSCCAGHNLTCRPFSVSRG